MQSSQNIFPIVHPKRVRRETRSWKHRSKKVTQYRIVNM